MITLVQNVTCLKLPNFVFLLVISEILKCLLLFAHSQIVLLGGLPTEWSATYNNISLKMCAIPNVVVVYTATHECLPAEPSKYF